jgi:NitT/TauT family transport system permease protein
MAAEIFKVGSRDFRLPGLGSYLQSAANDGNIPAILWGLGTLIAVIVLLDQFVWRPLITWTDKFKLEMLEGDQPPSSWFLDLISRAWLVEQFGTRVWQPFIERVDAKFQSRMAHRVTSPEDIDVNRQPSRFTLAILVFCALLATYGAYRTARFIMTLSVASWVMLIEGIAATFLRVTISLVITLLWTVPVGVLIGTNRRLSTVLQPVVQVIASVPATALFPVLLLMLLRLPGGLNIAAVMLMLMGTQWYMLFNVIAGAAAIPVDLKYTTDLLRLSTVDRWRILILPALFPYIITGAITASGGAWNASIIAEHVEFGGQTYDTVGVGALIAQATARAQYPVLLAATLALVLTVVFINRTFWRRLYRIAESRYRMD